MVPCMPSLRHTCIRFSETAGCLDKGALDDIMTPQNLWRDKGLISLYIQTP